MNDDDRLAFRFDCGATWLNLLATSGRTFSPRPVERLSSPERLAEWLDRSGVAPLTAPGPDDVRTARDLRETLRPVALAVATGEPPPADAVAGLQRFLDAEPDTVRLIASDRLLRSAPATAAAAFVRIARQAVDHLTGPERADLAVCAEGDCRAVFSDQGGRRRWCPSAACASRGRVRAHRERRRAARATD
ncbi:CGNR zinc finger domain-containing protein [Streptomyces sp. RFCAC02]|uniref:CGNR zinc finger domain-containing protein n=1 Tax=Streptomyces sp. RFCAC02 TaxID=2499143 RepID=UPI0010214CF1|nr:CGNR zinc finger domain-containing protein [Streptomyces sp. RFCAC02]